MSAGDELVDILDEDGNPVRVATRAEARAGNLLHRSVFVAVVTGDDHVVVHQRAPWKDVWPSRWDVCFGGVVDAGEEWGPAAIRELAEESGVTVRAEDLVLVGAGRYEDDRVREVSRVYLVRTDGPFTFPDGEVAAWARVPRADLPAWSAGHDLVPDSALLVLPHLLPTAPG